MSTIADPITAAGPSASPPAPPARGRSAGAWLRVGLACGLLAAAGGFRVWQGRQVDRMMSQERFPSFPLEDLPKAIGPWGVTADRVLDPAIARNAGSSASINRTYTDDRTGVQLGVLILYGPALFMHIHSPEVCYPGAGYTLVEGPTRLTFTFKRRDGSAVEASAAALTYTKGEGPSAERKQVFYTWGYNGRWTPDLLGTKQFQRIPGMFKVHIDRRVAPDELLDVRRRAAPGEPPIVENPSESLLKSLLPEMEERMHAPRPGPAG